MAEEIVVDLMAAACRVDYAEGTREGIARFEIGGVMIPVATKPMLIRMKDTFRPSDRTDVEFLRLRLQAE